MCNENWAEEKKFLLWCYLAIVLGITVISAFEKSIFGVMGEKLISGLRMQLVTEMLHK